MSIVRHLRALADKSSYSRRVGYVKGGVNHRTGEVWEPRQRKRSVHRRVKRWRNRNGYGYIVVNDGSAMAEGIARIVLHHGAHLVVEDPDRASDDADSAAAGYASSRSDFQLEQKSGGPDSPRAESALWAWGQFDVVDYFDDLDPVGGGDQDCPVSVPASELELGDLLHPVE